MTGPEKQASNKEPDISIISGNIAYRAGTHFLSSNGQRMMQFFGIESPTLNTTIKIEKLTYTPTDSSAESAALQLRPGLHLTEAFRTTKDHIPDYEVAWVEFYASMHVDALINGEEHALDGKPLIHIGETYLATNYQDNEYSWASLSELASSPELPIYTAEWLARFLHRASIPTLTNPGRVRNPPFTDLTSKPPLVWVHTPNLEPTNYTSVLFESSTKRMKRLAQAAVNAYPHLRQRYIERGIYTEE